jgi:hypothetical protein
LYPFSHFISTISLKNLNKLDDSSFFPRNFLVPTKSGIVMLINL